VRTHDDTDVARRFRAGDPDAVREVVRRHAPTLRAVSRSLLRDGQAADDAVQLTFVRAWRAADRVDPERPLGAWLATICRRACIDVHRRDRRATEAITPTGAVEPPTRAPEGESVETEIAIAAVRRAVDRLPADERDVVRSAYDEGWSYARIARQLGVPVGTVKSRAFRAHRRLARSLAPIVAAA
jgi:RNA polymerase sigma-70 factor (ECF subfamily)